MNVEDLLARHEGKTLEFKRDASSSAPILRTLSAFSNTAGGVLTLGVQDRKTLNHNAPSFTSVVGRLFASKRPGC